MKLLVVDDEPLARARLRSLIEELGAGEVVGEAGNGHQALALVEATGADVVLLDVRMPGMDGIETARHLSCLDAPPAIVFTTAYEGHALAAFETCATAYLLKPVRREHLAAALERASTPTRAQLATLGNDASAGTRSHIAARVGGNLRLVPVEEVRFLRAEDKYVTVRYPGGELVLNEALGALEQEFGARFLRVHRNALVAVAHIRAVERGADGGQVVRLDGIDDAVEVSRRMLGTVRRYLSGSE